MDIDATQALDLNITEDDNKEEEKKLIGKLITVAHNEMPATEFEIFEGVNIIGRDERSQISVTVKSLSKKHACIEASTEGSVIYDFDSRNKTRKGNGKMVLKPLVRYEIRDGDVILFGNLESKFVEVTQEYNDNDETGSITASESDGELESKNEGEKKIFENDSDEDEENSPSILPLGENNNVLLKNDDLDLSDIVLPTQQKSKNYSLNNDGDVDDDSDNSFQHELQKLAKETPLKDEAYAVETDDSESEGEAETKKDKNDERLTVIGQTPGYGLIKDDILPESDLDLTVGPPEDKSTQPPDEGTPISVDPKILFLSQPEPESDNLSCDFSAAVAEDERFADTIPIPSMEDTEKVESNGTIGRLLAEQFADTIPINKDDQIGDRGGESDTDCEVKEDDDEEDDHHNEIVGTYQFDTDNFNRRNFSEDEEEGGKDGDDKKIEPVKTPNNNDHASKDTVHSQEIPFSFKTSSRLVEGLTHSFGTPASSINASVETTLSLERLAAGDRKRLKTAKMIVSDSEGEEEATQAYNMNSPEKDTDGFAVPKFPLKGLSLPGASSEQTEVYDVVDAATQMTSSKDKGKPNDEFENEATQAYGGSVATQEYQNDATQAYGGESTQAYANTATQAYGAESTQAYANTATQAYGAESTQAYANMATQPFHDNNDVNNEDETQAYMGDIGLDEPDNDSDVTLSDNEQEELQKGEEQIAKNDKEAKLLEPEIAESACPVQQEEIPKEIFLACNKEIEVGNNDKMVEPESEPELSPKTTTQPAKRERKGRRGVSRSQSMDSNSQSSSKRGGSQSNSQEGGSKRRRTCKEPLAVPEEEEQKEIKSPRTISATTATKSRRGRKRKTILERSEETKNPEEQEVSEAPRKTRKKKAKLTPPVDLEIEGTVQTKKYNKSSRGKGKGRNSTKSNADEAIPEEIEEATPPVDVENKEIEKPKQNIKSSRGKGKGRKSTKSKADEAIPEEIEQATPPVDVEKEEIEEPKQNIKSSRGKGKGRKSTKSKADEAIPEEIEEATPPVDVEKEEIEEPKQNIKSSRGKGKGRKSTKSKADEAIPEEIKEAMPPVDVEKEEIEEPKQNIKSSRRKGKGRKSTKSKADEAIPEEIEEATPLADVEPKQNIKSLRGKARKSKSVVHEATPEEIDDLAQTCSKPKVVFTGISDQYVEKIVTSLGGATSESVEKATHLVADKVRRTVKFMCALGKGIPIVTPDWLIQSKKNNDFVVDNKFILLDKSAEKQYKFSLRDSLEKSKKESLLTGVHIHVTKSVKPEPKHMKEMIECCGGTFVKNASKLDEKVIVISCEDDAKEHSKFTSNTVCSNELLLTGILRQELDFEQFTLVKNALPPTSAKSNRKSPKGRGK